MVRGSLRCGVASSSPIVCAVRTPVLILGHLVDIATDGRSCTWLGFHIAPVSIASRDTNYSLNSLRTSFTCRRENKGSNLRYGGYIQQCAQSHTVHWSIWHIWHIREVTVTPKRKSAHTHTHTHTQHIQPAPSYSAQKSSQLQQ
jgi:hypothetical protein